MQGGHYSSKQNLFGLLERYLHSVDIPDTKLKNVIENEPVIIGGSVCNIHVQNGEKSEKTKTT